MNENLSEKAPDLNAPISTFRLYCTHNNSPAADATGLFEGNTGDVISLTAAYLAVSLGLHEIGFVFNEDTETPVAVLGDIKTGTVVIVWNFQDGNDFASGDLHFNSALTSTEFNVHFLVKEMTEALPGVQVMGFDENGPFKL